MLICDGSFYKEKGDRSLFGTALMKMIEAYEAFLAAQGEFSMAIFADSELPIYLPGHDEVSTARKVAVQTMTRNFFLPPGETEIPSGIVCSSEKTLESATQLNQRKDDLQVAITEVREIGGAKKTSLDKLVDRALHREGRRTDELDLALGRMKLRRLDLLRCYAHIRILPPELESVSWTWATKHSSIKLIDLKEAEKMAEALPVASTRNAVLMALGGLKPGEKLALRKSLPNALRANIVWWEDKTRKRKAINVSGIMLSPSTRLPKHCLWRDDPGETPPSRLERSDVALEKEPYIKALKIYRYMETKEPV